MEWIIIGVSTLVGMTFTFCACVFSLGVLRGIQESLKEDEHRPEEIDEDLNAFGRDLVDP